MTLLELTGAAREHELPFLVIGGHAVIGHGHPRNTFDLDLVVSRSSLEAWRSFALARGFAIHREGATFIQFNPPDSQTLALDLMLVSDDTFRQFEAAAVAAPLPNGSARMVGLRHLLALKAHAIRYGHAGRVAKDVDDFIELVRVNHINVTNSQWRDLFLKYGTPELHANPCDSNQNLSAENLDLDLPDWSQSDRSSSRVSPAAAFALCEQYAADMPELVQRLQAQRRTPCPVEFVL